MLTVTKVFDFCYGHYLPGYDGKCANFHGHNSVVEVEIMSFRFLDKNEERYPGMVMDFSKIKETVKPIIDELDHQFINKHKGFLEYCERKLNLDHETLYPESIRSGLVEKTPTAELICCYLVEKIREKIPGLVRLRITETSTSWAEWRER